MLIGFALAGRSRAESLGPFPVPEITGPSPDPQRIDTWFAIHADNSATLFIGKPDIGQGNTIALTQIAAEELDLAVDQIRVARQTSGVTPDQGEVDASSSITQGGAQLRLAAAEARAALLALASRRLGVPADRLTVEHGIVSAPGASSVTYGELIGDARFDLSFTGKARPKAPSEYRVVGQPVPRGDIRAKVSGSYEYMQFVRLPGMLHGRVVRPMGQYAFGIVPKVLSVDERSIAQVPGARLVREADFIGVVAPSEWGAVRAAKKLKVQWDAPPESLPGSEALYETMLHAHTQDSVIKATGAVEPAFAAAAHLFAGRFEAPYQAHGPFAPHCALADVRSDHAEILTCTQGVYATRFAVSQVLPHLPIESIVVTCYEGSGTYGSSCYNDVAQCAALMSRLARAPVRVQFMREDEFGWDNYGPAHVGIVKAAADAHGQLTAYEYHGWQHGWTIYDAAYEAASGVKQPMPRADRARVVNELNLAVMYDVPNRRLVNHHIDARDGYLRGYSLRSPLDLAQTFASEQAIDALAVSLAIDSVAFRRRNISDPRWRAVLERLVEESGWPAHVSGAHRGRGSLREGWGVGLGTHFVSRGGAVAKVQVNTQTGHVRVMELWGALDAGLIVNPANVEAQIIGMQTQAASRMLHEEVSFDRRQVTSLDWSSYSVLRFDEHPRVHALLIQRPLEPSTGAGEEVMGATGAAIANAFFDATGVRLHRFPFTAERIKAALAKQPS